MQSKELNIQKYTEHLILRQAPDTLQEAICKIQKVPSRPSKSTKHALYYIPIKLHFILSFDYYNLTFWQLLFPYMDSFLITTPHSYIETLNAYIVYTHACTAE